MASTEDAELQALYDSLVNKGTTSLTAAANVGVTIEKKEIADLDTALTVNTAADVERVLEQLRSGSENHLAAFTWLEADPTSVAAHDGTGAQQGKQGSQNAKGRSGDQRGNGGHGAGRSVTS